MKSLFKVMAVGLTSAAVTAFAIAPVAADGTGQIEGGDIYRVENVTQNIAFNDPIAANACDTLEYKVRLHNSGFDAVTSINVAATLPSTSGTSNVSSLTATYGSGVVPSTSDTATVNLTSAQTISYVAGSTQLLDTNNSLIEALPDGITGAGVNVGDLADSTTEFVQFEAKVGCPAPVQPSYACTALGLTAENNRTVQVGSFTESAANGATFSNAVINWDDNSTPFTGASPVGQTHQYAANGTYTVTATANFSVNGQNQTATSPACSQQVTFSSTTPPTVTPPATTASTPAAPTALVNTGPGDTIGLFAAVTAAGAVGYRWILARRLSRQ